MDEAALALEDTFEYWAEKCFEIPKTGKIIIYSLEKIL
jgi:hypothetical protein